MCWMVRCTLAPGLESPTSEYCWEWRQTKPLLMCGAVVELTAHIMRQYQSLNWGRFYWGVLPVNVKSGKKFCYGTLCGSPCNHERVTRVTRMAYSPRRLWLMAMQPREKMQNPKRFHYSKRKHFFWVSLFSRKRAGQFVPLFTVAYHCHDESWYQPKHGLQVWAIMRKHMRSLSHHTTNHDNITRKVGRVTRFTRKRPRRRYESLFSEARAQGVSTFLHQNYNKLHLCLHELIVFHEQASSYTLWEGLHERSVHAVYMPWLGN